VVFEVPADADEATREQLDFLHGGVIYALGDALLGLRPAGEGGFSEDRTGLDHLAFAVDSHAGLVDAVATLEAAGVAHGGVKDIGAGHILEFRDPDGIALELYAPAASRAS
jgi:catechol-2,3-dioxygenase